MGVLSKRKKENSFLAWLTIIHAILALTPILNTIPLFTMLDFAVVAIWLLSFYLSYRQEVVENSEIYRIIILSSFILLIVVSYHIIGLSTASIGKCIRYWEWFMSVIMGWFCCVFLSEKRQKWVLYSVSFVVVINLLDNIRITYGLDPESIELLMNEMHEMVSFVNFGGTSFTGVALFFCMIAFMSILYSSGYKRMIFVVMFCISTYYTVYCGMRGTTVIMLLLFLVVSIYSYNRKSGKLLGRLFSYFMIFAFVIVLSAGDTIVDMVVSVLPSERLAIRFMDAYSVTNEGISDDSFTGRTRLYEISINSWLDNWLSFCFGIGEKAYEKGVVDKYSAAGISGHSDLIDLLAKFGIMGSSIFFYLFYIIFKLYKKAFHKFRFCNQILAIYIIFILYGVLKRIFSMDIALVIFVLLPLAGWYLSNINSGYKVTKQIHNVKKI